MKTGFAELDVVEVTADQDSGVVEDARGTVVAVSVNTCTVEFLDRAGYTIGLFEIPVTDLELISHAGAGARIARED